MKQTFVQYLFQRSGSWWLLKLPRFLWVIFLFLKGVADELSINNGSSFSLLNGLFMAAFGVGGLYLLYWKKMAIEKKAAQKFRD